MSRQRSRSPLHSRTPALGRRDGYYGEQYHMRSDPWRSSENVDHRNAESGVSWDTGFSQTEEQVDHWAKLIEAIDRAEKRQASSAVRSHAQGGIQDFHQESVRSPRRIPRERLPSQEALHYSMETHPRIQSQGQRRNEHDEVFVDRRYSRSSSPRHSQGRRRDRMERRYPNEEHEGRPERSSYSERSLKSNSMEPQQHFKQFEEENPQEGYTGSRRGFGPRCATVIVEHGHGIQTHDARSLNLGRERATSRDPAMERGDTRNQGPSRDRERPRSRDPAMDREHIRIGDPVRAREHPMRHDPVAQRGRPRSHGPGRVGAYPKRCNPVKYQEHPRSRDALRTSDLPRDGDFPKSSELQRAGDPTKGREYSRNNKICKHGRDYNQQPGTSRDGQGDSLSYDVREDARFRPSSAESNRARGSDSVWEEETHSSRMRGGVLGQGNILEDYSQHRNVNDPGAKMNFSSHETLKIKVDMSRPVGQSSHLGYSSERQLSLDLVNVGRQRLDFLPMLEHSGSFKETPMHSGTFAQEIITLVHYVKESYFQGQDMTLNERFSNEEEYSLTDEFAQEAQDMEDLEPVVNRPFGSTSSDMQEFGPLQSQRKLHVPAPGDLRHDLERKRQERLEGVKITIAGQNFSQILPQSQENESAYAGDEDPRDAGWSNDERPQPEYWHNKAFPKRPPPSSNSRGVFRRGRSRQGLRVKRNANNGARW